jgi:hypothetical protein
MSWSGAASALNPPHQQPAIGTVRPPDPENRQTVIGCMLLECSAVKPSQGGDSFGAIDQVRLKVEKLAFVSGVIQHGSSIKLQRSSRKTVEDLFNRHTAIRPSAFNSSLCCAPMPALADLLLAQSESDDHFIGPRANGSGKLTNRSHMGISLAVRV